jgi:predicted transglutaminase-like cysteine proteinase
MITNEELRVVEQVFGETRHKFIWTRDSEKYKVPEHWARPTPDENGIIRDDCDGFVIEIIDRLILDEGVGHAKCIYPAIVQSEFYFGGASGYDHMVGIVECDNTYYVIDNRSVIIRTMELQWYKKWWRPIGLLTDNWVAFNDRTPMLSN